MPSEETEPAIPAIERSQIHALDRTAKGSKEHNYRDKATNTGHTLTYLLHGAESLLRS
jgi:hypothetical protein